mgnify:CR=1 FL=1
MTYSRRGVKEIVGVLLLAATSSGIAQAVEPPVPPPTQKQRIRGIYDDYSNATKLLAQKRYKDALAIFQRIYDKHGDYRDTYGGMIDCVLGLGRRAEARKRGRCTTISIERPLRGSRISPGFAIVVLSSRPGAVWIM